MKGFPTKLWVTDKLTDKVILKNIWFQIISIAFRKKILKVRKFEWKYTKSNAEKQIHLDI